MVEKKAALIEFNTWHAECLYPQLLFLTDAGYSVTLFCDVRQKNSIADIASKATSVVFLDMKKIVSLLKVRKTIIDEHIDNVILNTAQGNKAIKFILLPFPKRVRFFGTIHNLGKISSSLGQRVICRKVRNLYLLADYLMQFAPQGKLRFQPYSPCYLPNYASVDIEKPEGQIWAVVPGSVERKRRDYDFLLRIAQTPDFPTNVRIIILGNSSRGEGPQFAEQVRQLGLSDKFLIFNKFISNDTFYSYIRKADYLLALINPDSSFANDYMRLKLSGTFILSKAVGRNLLIHSMFASLKDFTYPSVFYDNDTEFIQKLGNPQPVNVPQPDFESDKRQYLKMLE